MSKNTESSIPCQCCADAAPDVRAATVVAPEDLRIGDFVAIASQACQVLVADGGWPSRPRVARVAYIPPNAGDPLKVVAVGLPFVTVKTPHAWAGHEVLDVRLVGLFRLDPAYGKASFNAIAPPGKSKKK